MAVGKETKTEEEAGQHVQEAILARKARSADNLLSPFSNPLTKCLLSSLLEDNKIYSPKSAHVPDKALRE